MASTYFNYSKLSGRYKIEPYRPTLSQISIIVPRIATVISFKLHAMKVLNFVNSVFNTLQLLSALLPHPHRLLQSEFQLKLKLFINISLMCKKILKK